MTKRRKTYEELEFSDDFMFGKVMSTNPDICRQLTEYAVGRKVANLRQIETQKEITAGLNSHGVRFDVSFADEEGIYYVVEMQATKRKKTLPLRSRYYQSLRDVELLKPETGYSQLPSSIVIFICPFDEFGLGYHRYTFRQRCEEAADLYLQDKTERIFLCASGKSRKDDVPEEVRAFLDYLRHPKKAKRTEFVEMLDQTVEQTRQRTEWRMEYMTLEEKLREEREEGFEEGKEEGRAEGRAEGRVEGREEAFCELITKGVLTLEQAAQISGLGLEKMKKLLAQNGTKI